MHYTPESLDALRSDARLDVQILGQQGVVRDLSRDNVIVHVGKPIGSITGWLGAIFWQVWVEPGDAPGVVHARIDRGEAQVWEFPAGHDKEALLHAARESALALAKELRATKLEEARDALGELEAAAAD